MAEFYLSTESIPIIEVTGELLDKKGIKLFVKRDDLIHPFISGNKWRKLRYNIEEMKRQQKNVMLTFGGSYSNHILATAAAGEQFGFKTIGIIRGEEPAEKNTVLTRAVESGMQLLFISRYEYKQKQTNEFQEKLQSAFGNFYLVPEGGANELGVRGCTEIISEIKMDYTHICCATGTGTTLAGISLSLPVGKKAIGFCVHKGVGSIEENINQWTTGAVNFTLISEYHFGGFAKRNDKLDKFTKNFSVKTDIPIEPVYTAKMFFGIYDLVKQNHFNPGSTIVALHTGGIHNSL